MSKNQKVQWFFFFATKFFIEKALDIFSIW
jgi:hypothetical protein